MAGKTTYKGLFLPENIDASWLPLLTPVVCNIIKRTEKQIVTKYTEITPLPEQTLRFLQIPAGHIKIIILGQDPYPQPGIATGRAFEVNGLKSWEQSFKNISLKNIVRLIYKTYNKKTLTYSEIKNLIQSHKFNMLPPDRLFSNWEQQGVLLLNTSFTCKTGQPGSHSEIWKPFTLELLGYLAGNAALIWLLWGKHAEEITREIPIQHKIITAHPMMCFNKPGRDNDFLFGKTNPFALTRHLVDWRGNN